MDLTNPNYIDCSGNHSAFYLYHLTWLLLFTTHFLRINLIATNFTSTRTTRMIRRINLGPRVAFGGIRGSRYTLKTASTSEQNSGQKDVSAVLLSSKVRVSKHDLKTIDMEISRKIDNKYERELDSAVLLKEVAMLGQFQSQKRVIFDGNKSTSGESNLKRSTTNLLSKEPLKYGPSNSGKTPLNSKSASKSSSNFKTGFSRNSPPLITSGNITLSGHYSSASTLKKNQIPSLSHELDRVLFSPGVHFLQDPRTRIYNYPKLLKNIIKLENFNFDKLPPFITPSQDEKLLQTAKKEEKRYYSSTSSMTAILSEMYKLFNNYDLANTDRFPFPALVGMASKLPATVIVKPMGTTNSGKTIYSIDSDKSADTEIVLSAFGHVLEAFLTHSPSEFDKFNRSKNPDEKNDDFTPTAEPNTYNYAKYGNFLLRSQLDCFDSRLPGKGTFDLKTRAVCSIRYDNINPAIQDNSYQIWKLKGKYESFEREYEDLIRTGALLKYGFQARIGQMDGIFIAYHNINTFFGFQYLPLSEIDRVYFSDLDLDSYMPKSIPQDLAAMKDDFPSHFAEIQFRQSLELFDKIFSRVLQDAEARKCPKETAFRIVLKADNVSPGEKKTLKVYTTPLNDGELKSLEEIPISFKTSFRDDISAKEKMIELQKHLEKLREFETSIQAPISYEVGVEYSKANGIAVSPSPSKGLGPLKLKYSIYKPSRIEGGLEKLMEARALGVVKRFEEAYKEGLFALEKNKKGRENTGLNKGASGSKIDPDESKKKPNDMRLFSEIGRMRVSEWERREK